LKGVSLKKRRIWRTKQTHQHQQHMAQVSFTTNVLKKESGINIYATDVSPIRYGQPTVVTKELVSFTPPNK
jgi:hypothetical protein